MKPYRSTDNNILTSVSGDGSCVRSRCRSCKVHPAGDGGRPHHCIGRPHHFSAVHSQKVRKGIWNKVRDKTKTYHLSQWRHTSQCQKCHWSKNICERYCACLLISSLHTTDTGGSWRQRKPWTLHLWWSLTTRKVVLWFLVPTSTPWRGEETTASSSSKEYKLNEQKEVWLIFDSMYVIILWQG